MAVDPINTTSSSGAKVCVVEPDAKEAQRIARFLGSVGAAVHHYADGQSLLADPVEDALCVISEMTLPDITGAELISALRARGNHTPVILLAEDTDVTSAVAGIRAGALDYTDKAQMERLVLAHLRRLMLENRSDSGRSED